jgi:hypothetical protein
MASELMIDDRLQIDKFNPSTWTGDFGVNSGGFPKGLVIDGSVTNAIDETPTDYSDNLRVKPADLSGNVYLKTIASGDAPNGIFTARKFEYSDGTVTWMRPGQPWSWIKKKSDKIREDSFLWVLALVLLVFLFCLSR